MHRSTPFIAALTALVGLAGTATAAPPDHAGKRALEKNPNLDTIPGSVIVTYKAGAVQLERETARLLADANGNREFRTLPSIEHMTVRDPAHAMHVLSKLPWVESVEPDWVIRPTGSSNDEFVGLQWGLNNTGQDIRGILGTPDVDIDAFEAWDVTTGDAGLVIAVIDSGVQWDHPDLDANIWSNPGEIAGNGVDDDGNGYVDDIRGWDFYDADNNPDDADGHGTHVAGTIGAESNNAQGTAGVVWQCQIMPLRFIGPFGGSTSDAIAAIDYAVAAGCKLSNNSWGGGGFSSALQNAIAQADAAGHLFVAASGNDGRNTDSQPAYPASYSNPNIISVANINNRGGMDSTSNYGSTTVDLGAPGTDIASTYNGNSYVWSSGTSMASPHVAGTAALIWSAYPNLTHDEVKAAIMNSAKPLSSMSGRSVTGGFLNANDALAVAGGGNPDPDPTPPAAPSGLAAADGGSGVVNLTWNDNSNDESGFEVQHEKQRRNGRWQSTTTVNVAADSTGTSLSLEAGSTYRIRVRSYNSAGASAWTGYAQLTLEGGGGGGGGGNGKGKNK